MSIQKLIILIGLPGSGKSTFADKLITCNPDYKLLSSNKFHAAFGTGEDDQKVTGEVFDHIKKIVNLLLYKKYTVVIDATNINKKDRQDYIVTAKKFNVPVIGYDFICSRETLIKRNVHRGALGGRNVPTWVIDKMLAKYEKPSIEEGFDEYTAEFIL